MPTSAIWPIPVVTIPAEWFTWRYVWWWRTVCPIGRPRGISGVTTDGAPLYPEPLAQVFGPIKHQICQFHVLKEHILQHIAVDMQQDVHRESLRQTADTLHRIRAKKRIITYEKCKIA